MLDVGRWDVWMTHVVHCTLIWRAHWLKANDKSRLQRESEATRRIVLTCHCLGLCQDHLRVSLLAPAQQPELELKEQRTVFAVSRVSQHVFDLVPP